MADRPDPPPASPQPLSRRRFLGWTAVAGAALVAGCADPSPTPSPSSSAAPTGTPPPSSAASPSATARPSATPTSNPSPALARRVLLRDGALADGRSDQLRHGMSILLEDGRVSWIRPSDGEGPEAGDDDVEVVDASGSTIVPGLVDAHAHLVFPGGAHWIDRGFDPPARMVAAAERNASLLAAAGIRWVRDVGSPVRDDPVDGRMRALALGVRDRWRDADGRPRIGYPYVRAAGSWVTRTGSLPVDLAVEVDDADALVAAAERQLDDGADLVKLYLKGPDATTAPWSVAEVRRVVEVVHARGATVTAHASHLAGARVGVAAGVDAIEHGYQLDRELAVEMAARGTYLVSTLTVMRSWLTFARTTRLSTFASSSGRRATLDRLESAEESVRLARAAGVPIATGTDFGGGSSRANQLAWEVESLVAAGLEPWQALGAATWRGGELLGEPDAGVVREGGPADVVLVHGDPLSDPEALWRTWWVSWA